MSVPATQFTPLASLAGGALIGLSAVMLLGLQGRIAGISGITARLFPPYQDEGFVGRALFVLGLIAAPLAIIAVAHAAIAQSVPGDLPLMVAAGLLVGFGSVWGNGCTSGHGVCGLARLSPRSLVATLVFMGVAVATVFVMHYVARS